VPIPWSANAPAYGFSPSGRSWLPQPPDWAPFARDSQRGVEGSTLELYRTALSLRARHGLGHGSLEWLDDYGEEVVAFRNRDILVIANAGSEPVPLPAGEVLLRSEPVAGALLPGDATVWLRP
jgi:alpha-glucosidase